MKIGELKKNIENLPDDAEVFINTYHHVDAVGISIDHHGLILHPSKNPVNFLGDGK